MAWMTLKDMACKHDLKISTIRYLKRIGNVQWRNATKQEKKIRPHTPHMFDDTTIITPKLTKYRNRMAKEDKEIKGGVISEALYADIEVMRAAYEDIGYIPETRYSIIR